MRQLYIILRNLLVFFFIGELFSRVLIIGNGTFTDRFIAGVGYGLVMMLIPNIIKFFKQVPNNGSLILVGLIVSLIFFLFTSYIIGFIRISGNTIDFGNDLINPIKLADNTIALVYLSVTSAVLSIGLDILGRNGR